MDYNPHHEPFQYYASTANPMHLPPTSVRMIGRNDQANHQYDIADFWAAADTGSMPAVSYLKAPDYQDGHVGYSDPTDEQNWLVTSVNHLESLPTWRSTAVVITYDDSDGWYDHVLGPVLTQSQTSLGTLTGTGQCGSSLARVPQNSAGQPGAGQVRARGQDAFLARLAVGAGQLRRRLAARPEFGGEVHRGQLECPGPGQRRHGPGGGLDRPDVRLRRAAAGAAVAQPGDRELFGRASRRHRRTSGARRRDTLTAPGATHRR